MWFAQILSCSVQVLGVLYWLDNICVCVDIPFDDPILWRLGAEEVPLFEKRKFLVVVLKHPLKNTFGGILTGGSCKIERSIVVLVLNILFIALFGVRESRKRRTDR